MTVKEFIDAVSKQPALLGEQLTIVTETQEVTSGEWDGGVQVSHKPVESVVLSMNGLLLFINPEPAPVNDMFIRQLPLQVAGPTPKALAKLLKPKE